MCTFFDVSRQAYYKARDRWRSRGEEEREVIAHIHRLRSIMPELGGVKIWKEMRGRKIGRDRLFAIMRENGLLVERKRKTHRTTDSHHSFKKYNNLIEDYKPTYAGEVLVSDITYVRTLAGYAYLFLVTDLYSRKIIGYHLSKNLGVEGALKALRMALKQAPNCRIHHSDRGVQYCCKAYIRTLRKHGIQSSMTQGYDPYQNAVAERINGILKYEFYLNRIIVDFREALHSSINGIKIYNNFRPHMSLDYLTPACVFCKYYNLNNS
jgi:transposase InsO family protein